MGDTLTPLRSAIKFSLWAWAIYWAGAGLVLVVAGMADPVSIGMALLLVGGFLAVFATGALSSSGARLRTKEWLVERPIYLVAIVVVVMAAGAIVPALTNLGIFVMAALPVAGLLLIGLRLYRHVLAQGDGVFAMRADQLFVLVLIQLPFALFVLIDATQGVGVLHMSSAAVAVGNWVQVAYPLLLLVAARPFREALRNPFARKAAAKKREAPATA